MSTVREKLTAAAVARDSERHAEFHRVANIVLGTPRVHEKRRVTDVIALGDGYVVGVTDVPGATRGTVWTTVVGESRPITYFPTWEHATLHLIARLHHTGDHDNSPAIYAGRVLGLREPL